MQSANKPPHPSAEPGLAKAKPSVWARPTLQCFGSLKAKTLNGVGTVAETVNAMGGCKMDSSKYSCH
jgi:hypothetical protein